jgi:hypothetical protein
MQSTPADAVMSRPLFRLLLSLFLLGAASGLTIAVGIVLWGAAWMLGLA